MRVRMAYVVLLESDMKAVLPLLFISSLLFGQKTSDEGFVLVKKEEALEVHERWIEFPGKQPSITSRELKSQIIINASMYELLALLKDESQVKSWQEHVSKYKIYLKEDTTSWHEYSRYKIPWPLDDQDSFMEYTVSEIKPGQELLINFQSKVDHNRAPVYDDVNRIELIGSWKIEQIAPNVVKVTYRIQSVPIRNFPRMIVDPVIRNNLLSTVKSLKELIESKN